MVIFAIPLHIGYYKEGVYKTKTEDQRPKTEDRRPKNEDPNFFARIRHGQLKNQAKAFLSANRCENNGDLRL